MPQRNENRDRDVQRSMTSVRKLMVSCILVLCILALAVLTDLCIEVPEKGALIRLTRTARSNTCRRDYGDAAIGRALMSIRCTAKVRADAQEKDM